MGIAGKLVSCLTAAALIILVVLSAAHYYTGQQAIDREQQLAMNEMTNRLAVSLRQSLYEFDFDTIKDTLLAEFPNRDLAAVLVWAGDRDRLVYGLTRHNGELQETQGAPRGKNLRYKTSDLAVKTVNGNSDVIGKVEVYLDRSYAEQRLMRQVFYQLAELVLVICLLVVILVFIVNRFVVRPLETVRHAMIAVEKTASTDSVNSPISFDTIKRFPSAFEELRRMRHSFMKMVEAIQDRQRRLGEANEALRESEERMRSVLETSPVGISIYDETGQCFVANDSLAKMIGATKEQVLQQNYNNIESWKISGALDKAKSAIKEDISKRHEIIGESTFGQLIKLDCYFVPFSSGRLLFMTNDISERMRAEEALRTSHERFITVLDSIDANVYVADMETYEILFVNKNLIENFGRDMTGEICWDAFRGEPEPCRDCTNDQLIDENGKPADVCVWQNKNPISEKWYINYDRAIEWTNGRLVRLQIATDITNFKRMEQQIQQTQKFEAIGTLAGGIAHDFNNLLMGIQGRASLMSVDLEPSHNHLEHITAIEDYIRSATDLTKQLLGFARGGKYEVKPTDISELVRNSANMFGRTKKEIRIHTKLENSPSAVAVDRSQIEQVLLNLYVNAWQAMPDGGELYLETKIVTLDDAYCKPYQAKPGRYAKVSVTDTGIGMHEAIRQRIFDPFFTTKVKGRGTGMGLASAYGIIKNHDGIITVYSEVNHGTTFNIYLSLSDKEAYREISVERGLIKGSETILLVDDEEMILDVGQAMLEKLGYRVVVVEGGEQAVDSVQRKGAEIDLVILDLIMPDMDGGKVFDCIKEILPQMPVMLSSGYAINGQADEIMKKGCNGFIQKPFNISELSQKIRKILDEAKITT